MYKFWTEKEALFLRRSLDQGKTLKEISLGLGRGYRAVVKKSNMLGLTRKRKKELFWTKEKIINKICELDKTNLKYVEVNHPKLYNASIYWFGSWKNAVNASGLTYIVYSPQNKWKSLLDENWYDSQPEAMMGGVMSILLSKNIITGYKVHKNVIEAKRWSCDFVITFLNREVLWLEYDGMTKDGLRKEGSSHFKKIEFYKQNKTNFKIVDRDSVRLFLYSIGATKKDVEKSWNKTNCPNMEKETYQDFLSVLEKCGKFPSKEKYNEMGKFNAETIIFYHGIWTL